MNPSGIVQCHLAVLALSMLAACSTEVPAYARYQSSTSGPGIRYELVGGLRNVPWPNDALCWLDDAPSGPCLPNVPTATLDPVIAGWVQAINATRGWSPNGPIVIPFERAADGQSGPAIDLSRFLALQEDADWSNDAIYVVDLETGIPHTLDFPTTRGSFVLHQPVSLDPSDPRRQEPSLTVETTDERYDAQSQAFDSARTSDGKLTGLPQYRPEWDTDSDGTLDVPVLLPGHPCPTPTPGVDDSGVSLVLRDRCLADGLVDAYDSAADVLRIYPRAPLAQNHAYSVVITDRLVDNDEQPIRSPFSSINHPRQNASSQRLVAWLKNPELARYYGTLSDNEAGHVRFVWSFTTGAPSSELETLSKRYQPDLFASTTTPPPTFARLTLERQYDLDIPCPPTGSPRNAVSTLLREVLSLSPSEERALVDSYDSIASVISGTLIHAAYLPNTSGSLGDAASRAAGDSEVPFWLMIPKSAPVNSPLRVVIVSHEQGTSRFEGLRWAGHWASLGLATIGFDRLGSGASIAAESLTRLEQEFQMNCAQDLLSDLQKPRRDRSTTPIHRSDIDPNLVVTRNRWHADALELATLARALQSRLEIDTSLDESLQLSPAAFVGIGTGAATAALATSLVPGEISLILVDPATSPERAWSRGATWGAPEADLWRVFGPRLAGVPIASLETSATRCRTTDVSLRLITAAMPGTGIEVGCLPLLDASGAIFSKGATVVATNVSSLSRRCVGMTSHGQFSLGLPAAPDDAIELDIYDAPDLVVRFGRDADCDFALDAREPVFVLGGGNSSEPDSVIVTTAGGLGLERQSSELLRALDIAASAFMLANPAPFVADLAQPSSPAASKGLLLSLSPGDVIVPTDQGLALARAARLIPRFPPENLLVYPELAADTTPTILARALSKPTAAARVESAHLDEGVPRLERFPPNASTCGTNVKTDPGLDALCHPTCSVHAECYGGMTCVQGAGTGTCQMLEPTEEACAASLPDIDALAGNLPSFGAVQPIPFLRLARYAGRPQADNLADLWTPQSRLVGPLVQPTHPDWPFVAMALPLANPLGSHGIPRDDLCHRFRFGSYLPYLLGHFIATRGTDYPPATNRETQQCLADPSPTSTCPFISQIE